MSLEKQSPAFVVGKPYNWKNQTDRLVYLGYNKAGGGPEGGFWHQFAKVDAPDQVWCEVLTTDLHMLEETKE
jgi:hypothetical protein